MNIHLFELKKRLIYIIIFILINFLIIFFFSDLIFDIFIYSLCNELKNIGFIITTNIFASFYLLIKLSVLLSLTISIPYILINIYLYLMPALYKNERKYLLYFFIIYTKIYFISIFISFYIMNPLIINFMLSYVQTNVMVMIDIIKYLNYIINFFFIFILLFQIPLLIFILNRSGILSKTKITNFRGIIIIISLIIGMLFTPPDVISQILLAIPIYIFFEILLIFMK